MKKYKLIAGIMSIFLLNSGCDQKQLIDPEAVLSDVKVLIQAVSDDSSFIHIVTPKTVYIAKYRRSPFEIIGQWYDQQLELHPSVFFLLNREKQASAAKIKPVNIHVISHTLDGRVLSHMKYDQMNSEAREICYGLRARVIEDPNHVDVVPDEIAIFWKELKTERKKVIH